MLKVCLFLMVTILMLSPLQARVANLVSVSGAGAEDVRERINQICGNAPATVMDQHFRCTAGVQAQSALIDLATQRDQSIINALTGFRAEQPLESRTYLYQQCRQHLQNDEAMFRCQEQKLGDALWIGHGMAPDMPRHVNWRDCMPNEHGDPSGIKKMRSDFQRDLCRTYASHLQAARDSLDNLKAQLLVKNGVGMACMIAAGRGRILAAQGGEGDQFQYQGETAGACFPALDTDALNISMPYAPTASRRFPEDGGGANADDLTSSRTGLWPNASGYQGVCAIGFDWAQDGMERTETSMRHEVCPWLTNQDALAGFAPELFHVMSRIQSADYFELLRLEAVARTIRAARVQLGNVPELQNMPSSCAPVANAYQRSLTSVLSPQELQLQTLNTRDDYPQAVQTAAKRIQDQLTPEARALESEMTTVRVAITGIGMGSIDDHHSPTVHAQNQEMLATLRARQQAIQNRLNEIQEQILADFERYPVLMVGRDHDEDLWESNPKVEQLAQVSASGLNAAYESAKRELIASSLEQIGDICNPSKVTDERLIRDRSLSALVLQKFPRFQTLHRCVMDQVESRDRTARVLRIGASLGCIAFGPIGGAVCGGLIALGGGYMDYERAQAKLSYEGQCRMVMGVSSHMCSSQDYLAAQSEFNETLRGVAIDGALEILLPVAGASLKFLSAARVRQFKVALEGAESSSDVRRIASEMEQAAADARRTLPEADIVPPAVVDDVTKPGRTSLPGTSREGALARADDIPTVRPPAPPTITTSAARRAHVENVDMPRASRSDVTKPSGNRVPSMPQITVAADTRVTLRAADGSLTGNNILEASYEMRIPHVRYTSPANPIDEAQSFLNSAQFRAANPGMDGVTVTLDASTELGRGGTRRVFRLNGDDRYVAKVYDTEMGGLKNLPAADRERVIESLIRRELALEDMLVQVMDNYRRAGLEPPFQVARIVRDPELLRRGIILQERYTGQTLDTLGRQQLDQLSPPPANYTPPTTHTVSYKGKDRVVDEHGEFVSKGGISHRELQRLPGVQAYQDFINAYDQKIREAISDRLDVGVSTRGGPDMTRDMGLDVGNNYGNVMLDPDGPGGTARIVIYDW